MPGKISRFIPRGLQTQGLIRKRFNYDLFDGFFIRTAVTIRPGGTIRVELNPPQGLIAVTGEVKWAKKVPQNFLHKLKGGMGVLITSFLAGEELYHALCDELDEQRGE